MCVSQKVLFLLMQAAVALSTLPEVRKCQLKDSNCVKSAAQSMVPIFAAGIQEVGSESLDPLYVDVINVDLAGLKLNIRDAQTKGLKKAVIDKLNVDVDRKQMQLVFHADLVLKGLYKASGRLLILPISGDGHTIIKLKNCELVMDFIFDIVNKDGKDYIDLKSFTYKYDVKDNANFYLSNLFNGNKAARDVTLIIVHNFYYGTKPGFTKNKTAVPYKKDMVLIMYAAAIFIRGSRVGPIVKVGHNGDTMHTFMNTSWKLLTQEFGIPMFNTPTQKVFNAIKTYLLSQPLDEITV